MMAKRVLAIASGLVIFLLILFYKQDWLRFHLFQSGFPKHHATLVTGFYNISSKHSYTQYLNWMENFLSLRDCMVVFVDSPEMKKVVRSLRPAHLPLIVIIRSMHEFIVPQEFKDPKLWDFQESLDKETNIGHNRELYWVWHEKANMLNIAADLNLYNSQYFTWLDIGSIRHTNFKGSRMLQHFPRGKGILFQSVKPFSQAERVLINGKSQVSFQTVDRIAGTMIGGEKQDILDWHQAYFQTVRRYIAEGRFVGKDQSVMATTCLETSLCLLLEKGEWFFLQNYFMGLAEGLEPHRLQL